MARDVPGHLCRSCCRRSLRVVGAAGPLLKVKSKVSDLEQESTRSSSTLQRRKHPRGLAWGSRWPEEGQSQGTLWKGWGWEQGGKEGRQVCACTWASLTQTGRSEVRTTEAARLNHLQRCSPGTPVLLPSHHRPTLSGAFYVLGLDGAWGDKVCPGVIQRPERPSQTEHHQTHEGPLLSSLPITPVPSPSLSS